MTLTCVLALAGAPRASSAPPESQEGSRQSAEAASGNKQPDSGKKDSGKKKSGKKKAAEPAAAAAAQATSGTEADDPSRAADPFRYVFRNYPSLRFGRVARVDFHAKVQTDFRGHDPLIPTPEGLFDLHRARVGISGTVFRHFEFEVEREIRDEFRKLFEDFDEANLTTNPWRDVYVNFRYFRDFQIQVGKFKVPFGMEQLKGASKLDFVYRARISDILAPGRDKGVTLHGRILERGLGYDFGYFREDGENARTFDNQGSGRRAIAGRVTGRPLRLLPVAAAFRDLELGAAFVHSQLPEGLGGLRGRTVSKQLFFDRRFVNGNRLRFGTELAWTPGPFGIQGEFIHMRDERLGQSIRGADLPEMISRGWYLTGSWVVTGEKKAGGVEPRRELLRGWGFGAAEIAVRYEQIRFGSSEHPGVPSRSIRAANILGSSDRAWTFGVNWYVNRWIKIQGNFIRERLEDLQRLPLPGIDLYWTRICRIQFEM